MTTPETARETPEWKATFIDLSDALPFLSGYHTNKLADAIYNAVQRAIPPVPVPSNRPAAPPSPASDSEKHAEFMRHLERCRAEVATWPEWKQSILGGRPPAPPPTREAERPKCPECRDRGRVDVEDGRGNVVMDAACPRGCSAPPPSTGDKPTPPPAPASKGAAEYAGNLLAVIHGDGGHYITKHGWIKAVDDAKAKWYDMLARAESATLSVTPPQQGEDRSWEKDCEVRNIKGNGWIVKYLGSDDPKRQYLHGSRWVPRDAWVCMKNPARYFPSEAAARAALSLSPKPPTTP